MKIKITTTISVLDEIECLRQAADLLALLRERGFDAEAVFDGKRTRRVRAAGSSAVKVKSPYSERHPPPGWWPETWTEPKT